MDNPFIDPRLNEIDDSLYRVSAKAILIIDNRILFVYEKDGFFGLPGGGVEHGQQPDSAIVRELYEEIGVSIAASQVAPQPSFIRFGGFNKGVPRLTLMYKVKVDATFDPKNREVSYRWVSASELDTLELGHNVRLIRENLKSLI